MAYMAYMKASEEMRACSAGPFLIGRYRKLAASVNAAERKAANTGASRGIIGVRARLVRTGWYIQDWRNFRDNAPCPAAELPVT